MTSLNHETRKLVEGQMALAGKALGHFRAGLIVFLVVAFAGTAYALARRKVWTSQTRVRVVSSHVVSDPTGPQLDVVEETLEARLGQFVHSRRYLQEIVDDLDLYAEKRRREKLSDQEVLEHMRSRLYFQVYGGDEFEIHFQDHDPQVARKVANRLVESFVSEREHAEQAVYGAKLGRLEKQLDEVADRLADAEGNLTKFKEVNAATIERLRLERLGLPAQHLPAKVREVSAETHSRSSDSPRLRRLRIDLRGLEEERTAMQKVAASAAQVIPPLLQERRDEIARDLAEARRLLGALRARYTEEYPDVRRAKARVDDLERQRRQADGALQRAQQEARRPPERLAALEQRIEETREEIRRAEQQQPATAQTADPAAVDPRDGSRRPGAGAAKGSTAEAAVAVPGGDEAEWATPLGSTQAVEATVERLETEIRPVRESYQKLLHRKLDVEFQAEQRRNEAARYVVIDPADVPAKPNGPSRALIVMIAGVVGTALGLGLMVLLALFDPRIYRPGDLETGSSMALLASVPDFETDMDRLRRAGPVRVEQVPNTAPGGGPAWVSEPGASPAPRGPEAGNESVDVIFADDGGPREPALGPGEGEREPEDANGGETDEELRPRARRPEASSPARPAADLD